MLRAVLYMMIVIFLSSCIQQNEEKSNMSLSDAKLESYEVMSFEKLSDTFPNQTLTIQQLNSSECRVVVQGQHESYSCDFDHIGVRSNSNVFIDLSKIDDMFKSYLVVNIEADTAIISCRSEARAYELAVFCSGPGDLAGKYIRSGTQ